MLHLDERSESGQVLIVGGVLFALALLALATVLNAAVFTGELATRRSSVGEDRAIGYQHAAEHGVGGSISHVNYYDYASREWLADALAGRVGNWSERASRHYAANRRLERPLTDREQQFPSVPTWRTEETSTSP